MKLIILLATIFTSTFAVASKTNPDASAFTKNGVLYLTILGDDCNSKAVSLDVAGICREDRLTRNWAATCLAEVLVKSTKMGCRGTKAEVYEIDLDKANVAKESTTLYLSFGPEFNELAVEINR